MDKEFDKELISQIGDPIRALSLELVKPAPIPDFWIYKFYYYEKGEVKDEYIMGKDMSEALFRFSKMKDMPFTKLMGLPR